jgi:hypothetical protein
MKEKILYKVLNTDLTSPYQGFRFEIGKEYHCNDFDNNKNNECSTGFYAVDFDGLSYAFRQDKTVFECEVWGKSVEINEFKRRYEYIKILRKLNKKEVMDGLKNGSEAAGRDLLHISFPVNPLKKEKPVTEKDIDLLKKWTSIRASVWASVRDSVGASVWDSVGASVWTSVWNSVGASVGVSVRASVWNSVWAYVSSLFYGIEKWKYIEHKVGENPFQPGIDLWKRGFVPSFDGEKWRLHTGQDAKIVYEWVPER